MSRLNELIAVLCPDGVEYVELRAVLDYEQPTKYIVKDTKYDNSYKTPVLTAGQSFILGYTNEENGIYNARLENPVIIFDDFTTSFHWVDFAFKVKSSAMKLLHSKEGCLSEIRYLYHAMLCIKYEIVNHTRQWIEKYSRIKIPLPPLPVQQEIVRILDQYSAMEEELEAKLQAELDARTLQLEYFRKELFNYSKERRNINVRWITLGDIGRVSMCKRIFKEQTQSDGDVPFYKIGTFGKEPDAFISQELFDEYKDKYSYPKKGEVLLSAAGTIGRAVIFDGTPSYFQDSNIVWLANDEKFVLNKYLYCFYSVAKWAVSKGGTISRLYNDNVRKTSIPIPPFAEQERIISILDRLDRQVNELKQALQSELEARRKQYEYYRDQLLTFKELKA